MDPVTLGMALFAGIGMAVGAWSAGKEDDDAITKLDKDKQYVEDLYLLQKQEAELKYKEAQEQANRNADRADKEAEFEDVGADLSEVATSNDFNATIDNLYLSQSADTYSWNNAAMQAGSNTGAAYANLAASGVRAGSSLSDAVLMESAMNSSQLQFSQDAKRRSDNNQLGSVLNQLAGNRLGIYQTRYGADVKREDALNLRNSYLENGYNYNLYQNQLGQIKRQYEYNIDQIKTEKSKHEDNKWLNMFTGAFNGGKNAISTGYNLMTTYDKVKEYKTELEGK